MKIENSTLKNSCLGAAILLSISLSLAAFATEVVKTPITAKDGNHSKMPNRI
jgi:hypothetical protein